MENNARLFSTNGIRGIFGKDLNLNFIVDVTRSLAKYFKKGPIMVGRDGRNSSEIIVNLVEAILNSSGLDARDVGMVPTPCLQYATKKTNCGGGMMITASHNPAEYNGIKPIASDGVEITREDELIVENLFRSKNFISTTNYGMIYKYEIISEYIKDVMSLIDVEKIKKRKLRIIMDLGNGVQALVAPFIAEKLGCKVIPINGTIDGNFPGRGSEPTPDKLGNLSKIVMELNADLGVAYDGDGDRSIFCDETGRIHWGDKTGTMLVKHLISSKHRNEKVICPINTTSVLEKVVEELGSKLIYTKVGSVEVSREMTKTNSIIGLEENGGFMYGILNQVRDGAMATVLMLELLSCRGKSFSDLISELPLVYQYKSKIICPENRYIKKIIDNCENHGTPKRIDKMDGVKIWIDEDSWIMIRPSGTEPLIRIYAESTDRSLLNSKVNEYTKIINNTIKMEN